MRVQIDQASLFLGPGTRSFYVDSGKFAKKFNAYRNFALAYVCFMRKEQGHQAKQLAKDAGVKLDEKKLERDVDEMISFEKKLAILQTPEGERRNVSELYNPVKTSALKGLISKVSLFPFLVQFDFPRYFDAAAPKEAKPFLGPNQTVIVSSPSFLKDLNKLLKDTDPRTVANYILFRYVTSIKMQLGETYEDVFQVLMEKYYISRIFTVKRPVCKRRQNDGRTAQNVQ